MARPATNYFTLPSYKESAPRHQIALLNHRLLTTLTMYRISDFGAEAKETTIREWRMIADEIGLEVFDRILDEHIRESRYFPTVAELRERAGLSKLDRDAIEVNQAWEFVCRFLQKHWHPAVGCYDNAPPIPPRIGFAVRQIGGLEALHYCSPERLHELRRDFGKAYRLVVSARQSG
jgi:hypothetical protein